MSENWLSAEVAKSSHHECLFLLKSHNDTLTYCLNLKLWNDPCPPRCAYYKAGCPGILEKLEARDYRIHCKKFIRKSVTRKKAKGYCNLYLMSEPRCRECSYQQG